MVALVGQEEIVFGTLYRGLHRIHDQVVDEPVNDLAELHYGMGKVRGVERLIGRTTTN